jgi:hypothetical protein
MDEDIRHIYMLADQAARNRLRTFAWYGALDASAAQQKMTPVSNQCDAERIASTYSFKVPNTPTGFRIWALIRINATAKGCRGYIDLPKRLRKRYNLIAKSNLVSVQEFVSEGGIPVSGGNLIDMYTDIVGSGSELHAVIMLYSYEGSKHSEEQKPPALAYNQSLIHKQELGFLLGTRVANTFTPAAGKSPYTSFYNSEEDFSENSELQFAMHEFLPCPGLSTTPLVEIKHPDKASSIILPGGMGDALSAIILPRWLTSGDNPPLLRGCGSATTSDAYGMQFSHNNAEKP